MQQNLKRYLINAFYSWCMDIGYTPLINTKKWSKNILPDYLTYEEEVVFNIHPRSVRNLVFGKDTIEFEALFKGTPAQVILDYESIASIYNYEDDYGLDFEIDEEKIEKKKPNLTLIKNDENS